ncbi:vesicle-associated protein 2-1-like [Cynara cardunculus var. scolymus]|uniref:vesicle-associated protein 2-1-like n=1 Tax=Cynara cardunculus var. scolymus TaxID=59895 RepID=UPI000D6261A1|nr:vesicle-associated protein 2-1-like [Cynara cardunculus var. scolymus]
MTSLGGNRLITLDPEELKFEFELDKPMYSDMRVSNITDKHVAFKVKTTSPKKYFVRPNTGVIQPWEASMIRVTLQAQHEYPPDMQCKDKFLVQSTAVAPHTDVDQNTFSKEPGKTIEEYKLKVTYVLPTPAHQGPSDDHNVKQNFDATSNQAIQDARASRDAARKEADKLKQELEMLKRKSSTSDAGFSMKVAIVAGVIGIMVGFLLNLVMSSPHETPLPPPPAAPTSMPTTQE